MNIMVSSARHPNVLQLDAIHHVVVVVVLRLNAQGLVVLRPDASVVNVDVFTVKGAHLLLVTSRVPNVFQLDVEE